MVTFFSRLRARTFGVLTYRELKALSLLQKMRNWVLFIQKLIGQTFSGDIPVITPSRNKSFGPFWTHIEFFFQFIFFNLKILDFWRIKNAFLGNRMQ